MISPLVLVLGDANVDLVIPLQDHLSDAVFSRDSSLELHGGGTAANTAAALARLGEQVNFIGGVGSDSFGQWVIDDLKNEGVNISQIQTVQDAFTSMVLAIIHPDGERELFVWPDSGGAHTKLDFDSIHPEIFQNAVWLHTTGLCLREEPVRSGQLSAMRLAKEEGLTVSLDLNLRLESWDLDHELREIFEQAVEYSDVVFGSGLDEILPFSSQDSIQAGAEYISDGNRTVIARLGADGAMLVSPTESSTIPAYQVDVVDTLGAGDAFNGGFISARLAEKDLKESIRWGNAVAALKITRTGARGLPTQKVLLEFLNS
jgi:sugar/nucleoside kinase (ribokinase family)